MDAIRVTVQRGDVVEAVHTVHVRSTGGVAHGDDLHCFLRSSLKPIQAVPLLEGYDDLDADELAIASASHQAEPAQLAAVRKLLARADAQVDDLKCGSQDGAARRAARPQLLREACRHARRLPRARLAAPPLPRAAHPLQQRISALVGAADVAVDGCGVPTFALALSRMAALFATTPEPIAPRCASIPSSSAATVQMTRT